MAFDPDFYAAANRHFHDAVALNDLQRYGNAGYHFGLAAECAIKSRLLEMGVRLDDVRRHFPELRNLALLAIEGRAAAELKRSLEKPTFFQGWSVDMRYAKSSAVSPKMTESWKANANEALGMLIG